MLVDLEGQDGVVIFNVGFDVLFDLELLELELQKSNVIKVTVREAFRIFRGAAVSGAPRLSDLILVVQDASLVDRAALLSWIAADSDGRQSLSDYVAEATV